MSLRRRRRRSAESLFDAGDKYFVSEVCRRCADFEMCGGLHSHSGLFGCRDLCCGRPQACDWVCRKSPDYKSRVQEIGGLAFEDWQVATCSVTEEIGGVVPMIYHGARRTAVLDVPTVAFKLAMLYDRRSGALRFASRQALCDYFKIVPTARIIVSGVDKDNVVERWWEIGQRARVSVIAALKQIGVDLVCVPNFSLCIDWPRDSDMAAMARIAQIYDEFGQGGVAAALHPNGRTDRDFQRWGQFLCHNTGIGHVSYEFSTGTALSGRRERHVAWLGQLAQAANRNLHLVLFGDGDVAAELAGKFAGITLIETTTFMKTLHRQVAVRDGNGRLCWETKPAPASEDLAARLAANAMEVALLHAVRQTTTA